MTRARGKPKRKRDAWVRQAAEDGLANGLVFELPDPDVPDSDVSDSEAAAEVSVAEGVAATWAGEVMVSVADVDSSSSPRSTAEVSDELLSSVAEDSTCFAELVGISAVVDFGVDVATAEVWAVVRAGSLEM